MKKNRILASTLCISYIAMLCIVLAVRNIQFHSNDNFMVFAVLLSALPLIGLYIILSNEKPLGNGLLILLLLSYVGGILSGRGCSSNTLFLAGIIFAIIIMASSVYLHFKGCNIVHDETLKESHLIMVFSHIQYVLLLIFMFFEATTVFSIIVAIITVIYLILIRFIIKKSYEQSHRNQLGRQPFVLAAILQIGILSMLFLLMPYHRFAKIAYLLSSNTTRFYMDRGVFILVAMVLEIPFSPLFKVTRKIRKES